MAVTVTRGVTVIMTVNVKVVKKGKVMIETMSREGTGIDILAEMVEGKTVVTDIMIPVMIVIVVIEIQQVDLVAQVLDHLLKFHLIVSFA